MVVGCFSFSASSYGSESVAIGISLIHEWQTTGQRRGVQVCMCLASLIAGRQDKLVRQRALKCVHCGPKPLALVAVVTQCYVTCPGL